MVPTCVSARHIAKYARKTRCSNLNAGWAPDDADNIFNASNRVKGRRLRSQSSHQVGRRFRTGTPKTPLLLTKWCPSRLFPSVAVAGAGRGMSRSFRTQFHQKSRHHPKAGFLQYPKHGILVGQPAGGPEIIRSRSASGCASLESALGPLRAAFFKIRFGAAVLEGSKKGPQTRDSPE